MRNARHRLLTWAATAALVVGSLAIGLALVEAIASVYVPAWPARALRSVPPDQAPAPSSTIALKPWMSEPFNSWGMRDREHPIDRPPGTRARFVFVGDSFVEFQALSQTLPGAVEKRFLAKGVSGIETINLGVSGTGVQSYFYRLRDVAMKLAPDAVSVFFFSGNDFVLHTEDYSSKLLPPLIDESPGRSIIGGVMPRTNWLLVNRLNSSEFLRINPLAPDEFGVLQRIVRGPREERVAGLVEFAKRYYFPHADPAVLAEILSRGDGRLLTAFEPRQADEEYLMGWLLRLILDSEQGNIPFQSVRTRQDAAAFVDQSDVDANLSWLRHMNRVARAKGVALDIFVIPAGTVDPDFVEFWKPWPRYYSWFVHCDLRHDLLVEGLKRAGLPAIDLRPDFDGVPKAYRKGDGHWTEQGLQIAASRVFEQLSARFSRLPSH